MDTVFFFPPMMPSWDTVFWIPPVSWLCPLPILDCVNAVFFSTQARTNIWPSVQLCCHAGWLGTALCLFSLRAEEPLSPVMSACLQWSVPLQSEPNHCQSRVPASCNVTAGPHAEKTYCFCFDKIHVDRCDLVNRAKGWFQFIDSVLFSNPFSTFLKRLWKGHTVYRRTLTFIIFGGGDFKYSI